MTTSSRTLVAQGFAAFAVAGALQAIYGPSLPALARLHGIVPSEAGAIVGAHAAGGLVALLANMALGGVTARRAMAAVALGAAIMAAGPAWWLTLVGAALVGGGAALNSSVFNRRFLGELGAPGARMLGVLNAMFGLGAVLGPLAFVAAGERVGPAYGTLAAMAALLAVLSRSGVASAPEGAVPFGAVLRRPLILVLGALGIGLELSLAGLGPAALVAGGMAETRAALWASAFFGTFLAARIALWWLADRIAPLRMLAGAFALAGLACAAAWAGFGGAAYAVSGAAVSVVFPAYFVGAARRLGTGERVSALIIAAGYVGAVAVPVVLSFVLARIGLVWLFPLMAAYGLLAAGLALMVRRAE